MQLLHGFFVWMTILFLYICRLLFVFLSIEYYMNITVEWLSLVFEYRCLLSSQRAGSSFIQWPRRSSFYCFFLIDSYQRMQPVLPSTADSKCLFNRQQWLFLFMHVHCLQTTRGLPVLVSLYIFSVMSLRSNVILSLTLFSFTVCFYKIVWHFYKLCCVLSYF